MAAPTDDVKKEAKDGKVFYGYLFEKQKPFPTPKPLLEALLTAIALHIIDAVGDKNDKNLTPSKLAAFYKTAGYNYDGLFIEMPNQSISYIYQVQACQHILVQPGSDTEAPTIPALTPKGFVRWQSIQILLEPHTHVPIIQFAVRSWGLKNPNNGNLFPPDLPKDSFPLETDADTDLWHQECAVRLRQQATPKEEPKPNFNDTREGRSGPKDDQKPSFAERAVPFVHVRPPSQRDYFSTRGVNYVRPDHGIPRGVPLNRSPERDKHRERERDRDYERDRDRDRTYEDRSYDRYGRRHTSSSDEPPRRRRSHDQSQVPPEVRTAPLPRHIPEQPPPPRRHSQPRHISSSSSEDEDTPVSPGAVRHRRRSHHSTEPPSVRRPFDLDGVRIGSSHPHLPSIAIPVSLHEHGRKGSRQDDSKRSTLIDIKEKVMGLVSGTSERQRSGSRSRKDEEFRHDRHAEPRGRNHPHSKLRGSWSEYNSEESDSDGERHRARHRRHDKERDRDRDRDRLRDRDVRDKEREKMLARERSSHLRDNPRDRERDRDSDERRERERERHRDSATRRSREPSDEDLSPKSRVRVPSGISRDYLSRPDDRAFRRTSSHADIGRKRDWERDHDRPREDRYRDRDRDRDREKDRDRERERDRPIRLSEARMPSPGKGVKGRVYPDFNLD